jgi:HSP20 family protein
MLARMNRNYVPAYWDDFFNDSFYKTHGQPTCNKTSPAVNVEETDKAYRIDVAVPGLDRKDIRIDLDEDILTISSEQKEGKEKTDRNFTRREFSYNTFKRRFQIPESIDQENIQARHEAGILSIELPRMEEVVQKAPKQIEIQ